MNRKPLEIIFIHARQKMIKAKFNIMNLTIRIIMNILTLLEIGHHLHSLQRKTHLLYQKR